MRLGFGLTQEQTHKLMMTPELKLAIKILQLSTVDLREYIDEQLVENPVLEVTENTDEQEGDISADVNEEKVSEYSETDWESYFEDMNDFRGGPVEISRETGRYDNFTSEIPTLHDHLMFQLALAKFTRDERRVGEFLIGSIDDNGYLRCSTDEAAIQCDVSFAVAEKVLKVIQSFDPMGVGARDLKECLLIQYEQLGLKDDLMKQIISNYLEEVAEGKIMKVAKKIGIFLKDMQDAVDHLKLLEPKPGRKFSGAEGTRYLVPDTIVEKVDSEYIILVNDVSTPRLFINPVYKDIIRGTINDKDSRLFIEGKLNSAAWLIKSIEQRRITLYKVARCIVDFQRDFFELGIKYLKPLTLKQVAEVVGLHESTVSRATSNKYMQTPRGLLEMKFFFTSGIPNFQGSSTSAEVVKTVLRELIEDEDTRKPLSDQKISEILHDRGMDISRRTVAKYREELGILSTSRRRRY